MKIHLIAIGTKMPTWVNQAYTEYARRLPPECSLCLIEIPAQKRNLKTDIKRLTLEEGEQLWSAIPPHNYVIALTERGQLWNTATLAQEMKKWLHLGRDIALLVGGPEGLSQTCLDQANLKWSLSPLTWPHPLVRVMLAEQLYRAWTCLSHHPYHR